jgi:hypothetical protein
MVHKLYQSRGLPFLLNRLYFIFKIKGNLLFKSQKPVSPA